MVGSASWLNCCKSIRYPAGTRPWIQGCCNVCAALALLSGSETRRLRTKSFARGERGISSGKEYSAARILA